MFYEDRNALNTDFHTTSNGNVKGVTQSGGPYKLSTEFANVQMSAQ